MDANAILVSAPPRENGDPVLRHFADAIAAAPHLRSIVYLSTIGVYGDHKGEWVDETTTPAPVSERSRERLAAEQEWIALGRRAEKAVVILRLSGIYGPGQNAFTQLKSGRAKRIDKPGQFFNRIHVADIAQAIDAAFARSANGVLNVTDDKPTAQGVPVAFAAELLGVEPPPQIPFAEAAKGMTEMALSFYGESKRVRNDRLKRELNVTLRYPTFREGLARAQREREGLAVGLDPQRPHHDHGARRAGHTPRPAPDTTAHRSGARGVHAAARRASRASTVCAAARRCRASAAPCRSTSCRAAMPPASRSGSAAPGYAGACRRPATRSRAAP